VTTPTHARATTRPARAAVAGRQDSVSRAYHELRELIVWGQLPPGARIAERDVADRLGISRTPVRSALHRLQQEGFVASTGRGTTRDQRLIVTPVTRGDGEELFVIVAHLEGLAARMAASLPVARRKAIARRMRDLNHAMANESRKVGDANRVFDLDFAFHQSYVADVVGQRLLALHSAIKPQCERYARIYISMLIDDLSTSCKEHERIARAIADGDGTGAQRAAETNWHNASQRLMKVIGEHGERGSWHSWAAATTNGGAKRSSR
jgi:DNA-binding GntR family transcriptional regulator